MTDTPESLIREAAVLLERAREMSTPLTRADLKTMTPDEIVNARAAGRLDDLMKGN